jgi:peptidoglycan/LPS O-acetylase OafA/YrhL
LDHVGSSLDAGRGLAAAPGRRLDVVEGKGRGGWSPLGAARRAEYYASGHAPQVDFDRYDRGMRIGLIVLGILLIGAGLIWIAQGLNLPWAPRSFMTADRTWILIGAMAALAGAVALGWARQRT